MYQIIIYNNSNIIHDTSSEKKNKNYQGKDPMLSDQINSHDPTAVKRDLNDQEITEGRQTGTNTSEAQERYRKEGITKV